MTLVGLNELDGPAFARQLDGFLSIYAAAMRPPHEQLPGRRSIMQRHTTHPGFRCLVRYEAGHPIGFSYGFPGLPGQWWHDVVRTALSAASGERYADAWTGDSFEIGEIHVRPEHQGRGIGRSLITTLCHDRTERTALLSTHDAATPARALYRSLGFADLLTDYRFPGSTEPYAVLGVVLPCPPPPDATG